MAAWKEIICILIAPVCATLPPPPHLSNGVHPRRRWHCTLATCPRLFSRAFPRQKLCFSRHCAMNLRLFGFQLYQTMVSSSSIVASFGYLCRRDFVFVLCHFSPFVLVMRSEWMLLKFVLNFRFRISNFVILVNCNFCALCNVQKCKKYSVFIGFNERNKSLCSFHCLRYVHKNFRFLIL